MTRRVERRKYRELPTGVHAWLVQQEAVICTSQGDIPGPGRTLSLEPDTTANVHVRSVIVLSA